MVGVIVYIVRWEEWWGRKPSLETRDVLLKLMSCGLEYHGLSLLCM